MADNTWRRFGLALAAERKAAGYPLQVHLARAIGLQAVELCRYEAGRRLPSLAMFARLTGAGLDATALLTALDPEPALPAEQGTAHDEARPIPEGPAHGRPAPEPVDGGG